MDDDARIAALVEERVKAALATRRETDPTLDARLEQARLEQNRALQAQVSSARQEPENGYGSGREFGRARDLSRMPGAQSAAAALVDEIGAELAGTEYELEDWRGRQGA